MVARHVVTSSRILVLLASLAGWLGLGCGEERGFTGTPPPPPPHDGRDEIVFRVYTSESDDFERLRWVGTSSGPRPESPEGTEQPWIGHARPFRIEWEADSEAAPIAGTRYRASQSPQMPFLPTSPVGEPVYGDRTSFAFANETPASELATANCPGGPECPERLRWDTGEYRFEVLAVDELGNELPSELGVLRYHINYPPVTELLLDPPDGCGAPESFPQYEVGLEAGGTLACAFAPGDTIPVGARVRVRLGGYDRLASHVLEDSFCCDVRVDETVPEVLHQGRLFMVARRNDGGVDSLNVTYSEAIPEQILEFEVGPFDYTFRGRVKDGYGRAASNAEDFSFVSGFPPRLTKVEPAEGAIGLLRQPDAAAPWPENTIAHEVIRGQTRYWSSVARAWSTVAGSGRIPFSGSAYRVPLVFEGRPHSAEEGLQRDSLGQGYVAGVRSWTYVLSGEFDPDNRVLQAGGFDRFGAYSPGSALDVLRLDGEDAWEIFVPDAFWTDPTLFDPEGECPNVLFCEVGERLRADLGRLTLRVQGRSVAEGSLFRQFAPSDPGLVRDIPLREYGRRTAAAERNFEMRIGLESAQGDLLRRWPAP